MLLVSDAQGTGSITLDPGGQKASFRDYTPYGQVRAQAQAGAVSGGGVDPATAWTDPHQYLGLPVDPATGLNLLGARQYDPALGSFLQLDPVLEPGDPSQIGGYTYAGSDPVNGTDPTGLCVARYDDGALCTDGTIPGTGYTPTEYRQRTDKRRKQPPTGDRTDTTPGTGHRGGSPRRDHPTGPDNPNLIAAQHLAPLTAAIDNGWPVFVPQAYTPWEFCKNDRLTVQGLACVRALEDRPSNTPDPHTIAQTCGILLTPCGARVLVTLG